MAMMSSHVRALRTERPELIRMCPVPGRRQLMWPLKSITSARSIIESASASCCFSSAVSMRVVAVSVLMVVSLAVVVRVGIAFRAARVGAEDERLDGDRHRVRGHAHPPQVHVVEIPER